MTTDFQYPHFFSQVDVIPNVSLPDPVQVTLSDIHVLMREQLAAQNRQNTLLEKLLVQINQTQNRKMIDLALWKQSNPELSEFCRRAATKMERVQTDLLSTITEEIDENNETFYDSEYALNEFIDRYGMKFFQLNSLVQILSQLGNAPDIHIQQTSEVHKDV